MAVFGAKALKDEFAVGEAGAEFQFAAEGGDIFAESAEKEVGLGFDTGDGALANLEAFGDGGLSLLSGLAELCKADSFQFLMGILTKAVSSLRGGFVLEIVPVGGHCGGLRVSYFLPGGFVPGSG